MSLIGSGPGTYAQETLHRLGPTPSVLGQECGGEGGVTLSDPTPAAQLPAQDQPEHLGK